MKTTFEIPKSLLQAARRLAARERSTLGTLVEEGLRRVLAERNSGRRFILRKASFRGKGFQPEVTQASWSQIRDIVYEGRGS